MPNLILEFVQMRRRDTLQFVPTFDDNVVVATAVDLDVRACEIVGTPTPRKQIARRANHRGAAIDFNFNFNEGGRLH